MTSTEWEQLWLPYHPYATDDLSYGIYRHRRPDALGKRYIETNPEAISNLLVIDIDHSDAALRACWDRPGWMPTAVVENPENGHAHAVWALAAAVPRTEYARRGPIAYAAAVVEGLRRSVDGDAGYSGLMTKNPDHAAWNTEWYGDHLYTLGELEAGLGEYMPAKGWRRTRRKKPVGLGRNCTIFETARTWAYQEARRIRQRHEHATDEDSRDLLAALTRTVEEMNAEFSEPLPASETRAIARSIHRWITTRANLWKDSRVVSAATFTAIQSARVRKRWGTWDKDALLKEATR